MNGIVDEPELLTEVPPEFKKLARIVVRAFFEREHVAVINVLTKKSCVREDDLIELLKFDKRQLRTYLMKLKSDKLIKQRTHKEKQPETGNTVSFNYYFINYKVFVNVVKYKLNHIRTKIESEERQARNRSSYVCTSCERRYTDLDIDRLMSDIMSGTMTCPNCGSNVEEDLSDIQQTNKSRSLLALFNEQMGSIFELLRQCENVRLAPEVLEPEPDKSTFVNRNGTYNASFRPGWSTNRSGLETNDPGIKINMGGEDESADKVKSKEVPIWMKRSTVDTSSSMDESQDQIDGVGSSRDIKANDNDHDEIHAILLAHESVAKKPRLDVKAALGDDAENDSDSSDDFTATDVKKTESASSVAMETLEGHIESDDDDDDGDEVKVKIGDKMVSLFDVTEEMQETMTPDEHDAYTKACQLAYGNYYG